MSDEDNKTEDFQETMPEVTPDEAPKVVPHKKSKGKLVGLIIACVLVVAIAGAAVYAAPTIREVFSDKSLSTNEKLQAVVSNLKDKITNKKLTPDERIQKVVTDIREDLTAEYDKAEPISEDDLSNLSSEGTFSIKLGDTIMAMLPEEYKALSDLSGDFSSSIKDNAQAGSLSLKVDNKKIISASVITKDGKDLYIQIPELSDSYLTMDFASYAAQIPDNTEIVKALTDKESIKSLINTTFDIVSESITDVTLEENVDVMVDDIECTYDQLTFTQDAEQLKNFTKEFTTALSKEPIMTSLVEYMKTLLEQTGDLYEDVSMDKLLENIDDFDLPSDFKATYHFYLNKKNEFKGLEVSWYGEGNTPIVFSYMLAQEDKDNISTFTFKGDGETLLDLVNKYTKEDEACSGTLTATIYDDDGDEVGDIAVDYSDVLVSNNSFKGIFDFTCSEYKGGKLTFGIESDKEHSKVDLGISMAGSSVFDASFDAKISHDAKIPEIDSSASTFDLVTETEDYLNTIDIYSFIQTVTDATGIDIMSLLNSYY